MNRPGTGISLLKWGLPLAGGDESKFVSRAKEKGVSAPRRRG